MSDSGAQGPEGREGLLCEAVPGGGWTEDRGGRPLPRSCCSSGGCQAQELVSDARVSGRSMCVNVVAVAGDDLLLFHHNLTNSPALVPFERRAWGDKCHPVHRCGTEAAELRWFTLHREASICVWPQRLGPGCPQGPGTASWRSSFFPSHRVWGMCHSGRCLAPCWGSVRVQLIASERIKQLQSQGSRPPWGAWPPTSLPRTPVFLALPSSLPLHPHPHPRPWP